MLIQFLTIFVANNRAKLKMKHLFLLFFLLTTSLFGNVAVTENEHNALVQGIVNVITGDLYALEDDIVIQGREPLHLKRSYISAKGQGRWGFFEHLQATLYPPIHLLNIREPNGTNLTYHYVIKEHHSKKKRKEEYIFHPLELNTDNKGLTNTARGTLSAQTNLKNQYVAMTADAKLLTVVCPNGNQRIYKALSGQKKNKKQAAFFYNYHLQTEILPSGNQIIYSYGKEGLLDSIRTTDPSGQKTYAQATFRYHGKIQENNRGQSYIDSFDFDIHASDGRTLQYRHFCDGKPKDGGIWRLQQITSSDMPQETLHYSLKAPGGPILSGVTLPNARTLYIDYYNLSSKDANDPLCARIKTLSAPVGTGSTPIATHKFSYFPQQRKTIVFDVDDIPTNYYWDENLRLISIERFSSPQQFHSNTRFVWGANNTPDTSNLLCKIICDENRNPIHATRYVYDTRGNVIQEIFYGNLTGLSSPLNLGSNFLPLETGVESCRRNFIYSQEGRDLLLRQEEQSGLVITYEYLPNTNLPIQELSYENGLIKRRTFYEYDASRILINQTTDDGSSPDKNNLSNVKTRLIRTIQPKPDQPYLGLPQVIEEKYWDGQKEQLLKKTILHYTTGGQISKKEIFDANIQYRYSLSYTYDEKGRLKIETNALGQSAISDYDPLGNKTFFQNFGGRTSTALNYDYSNRLTESKEEDKEGLAHITTYRYNTRNQQTASIDLYGYETRYVYDPFDHLTQTHFPSCQDIHPIITSAYDAAGNEILCTDAKGYTTTTSYNTYGKPIKIQHPDGTEELFTYYLNGNLHTHRSQKGIETLYTCDAFNRTTSITINCNNTRLSQETFSYDSFHLIAKTDAEGNITHFEYDGAGRKIAEQTNQERTEYHYDPLGRLHITQINDLRSILEYDLLDRIIEECKEDTTGKILSQILYTYDDAGNRNTITRFIAGQKATEHFEYDPFNRLIGKVDPLSHETLIHYDDSLHQQTTIDPLERIIRETFNSHYCTALLEKLSPQNQPLFKETYSYDPNDNLILKATTLFHPDHTIYTQWEYGPLDRLHTLTEAFGSFEQRTTCYSYTPTGKPYQTIKPSGISLSYSYDPLDHLSSQISSDKSIHYTYSYDRLGRLLHSNDETLKTTLSRTYDHKGRLLTETLPTRLAFSNSYDTQGRRLSLTLPDTSFIIYGYDPLFLRTVTRLTSSNQPLYTHTYVQYDLAGNPLIQQLIAGSGALVHTYDPANRPTSCTAPHFNQEILEYDPVGNILQSRLNDVTHHYTYDDLNQLTSETDHSYDYDAFYNRLRKDSEVYSHNQLHQLPAEFNYDPDGNPLFSNHTCYTYDALDRLIAVENPAQRLTFTYDSYHRRLSKTIYTRDQDQWKLEQTLFFLYDDQNEIGSVDNLGNLLELRVLGRTPQAEIGSAVALELHGKLFVPIHDLHGNIATLISSSDNTFEEYRYTAFGEEKAKTFQSPWRFSSKRCDDETGLVYFGRRYYMPQLGRWLTPDPLGLDVSPNLYAYVSNTPLTHVDLYGLFDTWEMNSFLQNRSSWKAEPIPFKQMSIATAHGVGDFALSTGKALSTVGWGLTTPVRAVNWMTGASSFSHDWNSLQNSNAAFHSAGDRWMQSMLPGDLNSAAYRTFRSGVSSGLINEKSRLISRAPPSEISPKSSKPLVNSD